MGGRFAIAYAALVAVCYVLLRVTPQGGARDTTYAICAGVFASGAGLAILAVALGMITAASAADDLAARVHRQEVDQAVDRAVSEERARLDQLIHDDVMTTLTATAHASDPTSVRATASLAKQTLAKIEDLATGVGNGGAISYEMLGRLAADTSRRVSPEVAFVDESTLYPASARLPIAAAETLLSAMREAVRNALRHSGAQRVEVSFRAEWTVNGRDLLTIRVRDDGSGFRSRRGTGHSAGHPAVHDRAVGRGRRELATRLRAWRGNHVRDHQTAATPTRLPTERQPSRTREWRHFPQNSPSDNWRPSPGPWSSARSPSG